MGRYMARGRCVHVCKYVCCFRRMSINYIHELIFIMAVSGLGKWVRTEDILVT